MSRAAEEVFSIDLRSLALFRICLGSVLLGDLVIRATHFTAHYTDAGVVPRSVVSALSSSPVISLHLLSGSGYWQGILFVVAAIAAACLIIGYRSRVAAVLSWVMLLSLHAGNPYIINRGDNLLLNLVLLSAFLPLGRRWSVDARRSKLSQEESERVLSLATMAILLQVCIIYFVSVLYKTGDAWVIDYTAVYYALNIDAHATALGRFLSQLPLPVLQAATVGTLAMEAIGPLVALSPI